MRFKDSPAAVLVLALPGLAASPRVLALGEEALGNDPVRDNEEWSRGVLAVANHRSRVYRRWINGNEVFCFQGEARDLNEGLERFAAVEAAEREVLIRPGPGRALTFAGKEIPCAWQLEVPSGIYLALARKESGTRVFLKHARLTVFAPGGAVDLKEVKIPRGVTALGVEDLCRRLQEAMRSQEAQVRGLSLVALAELGAPTREALRHLAGGLRDPDEYVRRSAASALGALGPRAASVLAELEEALQAEANEAVKKQFQSAIEAVKAPQPGDGGPARDEAALLQAIREFIDRRRRAEGR